MKTFLIAILTAAASLAAVAARAEHVLVRHIGNGPFRVSARAHAPISAAPPNDSLPPSSVGFAYHAGSAPARSLSGDSPRLTALIAARSFFSTGRLRRDDAPPASGGGAGAPAPQPQTLPPGSFGTVPGALLRSEGLGYKMSAPDEPQRTFAVEAGDRIVYDETKGRSLSDGRGVFVGPRDTPPPLNSIGPGTASGNNAITPNPNVNVAVGNSNSSSGGGVHDYGQGH